MSDLSVTLEAPLDGFVEEQVRSGAYPDAAAVVRDALGRLREAAAEEAAKEARFRGLIQEALDSVERGEVIRVEDLRAFFDALEAEVEAAAR